MKPNSIHAKLTRSYYKLIAIIILSMLLCSLLTLLLVVIPNVQRTMLSSAEELSSRIDEKFDYLGQVADAAFLSFNQLESKAVFDSSSNQISKYSAISNQLYMTKQIYTQVDYVFLFDTDGTVYADDILLEKALAAEFDPAMHEILEQQHGRTVGLHLFKIDCLSGGQTQLISGKLCRNISNGKTLGLLYTSMGISAIESLYDEYKFSTRQEIFLCDSSCQIISSSHPDLADTVISLNPDKEQGLTLRDAELLLYRRFYCESADAYIVVFVPLGEAFSYSGNSALLMLFTALIGFAVALREAGNINKRVLEPLNELTSTANRIVGGDMQIRCHLEKADDEIGELAASFNQMLDKIAVLIKQLMSEQEDKNKAELAVQQNRLQPHFLNNSFNSIYCLCQLGENERAAELSMLVAEYYRDILNNGKDIVTVAEELEHLNVYWQIVKITKGNSIELSIACDDDIAALPIPKQSLQPLVENAIKYAFPNGQEGSRVSVRIYRMAEKICVEVSDNGIGVDSAQLMKLNESCTDGHYGLFSVRHGFKLMCGNDWHMNIHSAENKGTTVSICYSPADES